MKRRCANLSFAFKIILLGLLILLGKFGRKAPNAYAYNKQQPIHVLFDSSDIESKGESLFFENVTWQKKE